MLAKLLTEFKIPLIFLPRTCYGGSMKQQSTVSKFCRAIIAVPFTPELSWHVKLQMAATAMAIGFLIGVWSL